jgi:NAD(P)-dependent dehydrogenase (short-subunit alcohol dehydrogenase family)
MFDLTGRVALVTGAGQGVGAGLAQTLADAGATVVVNDLRGETAERSAEAIRSTGGEAIAVPFDVTNFSQVEAGIREIEAKAAPVDVLVNNAGIAPGGQPQMFRDSDPEHWRPWIDVNIYGVLNCCRAVVNGMCERKFGRIVTISSGAGTVGLAIGMSAYAAGKGGGISFMRHLAMEAAESGVTANTLALGMMDNTAGLAGVEALQAMVPLKRLGSGKDVGAAVVWLATEGSWVTGQTIELNGGATTT